jgi:small subunit ribosomal protein S8
MTMTDPLGDMLTRIRNGLQARKDAIGAPASRTRERLLEVLQREGYIRGFERVDLEHNKAELKIMLKYHEGDPVITSIARVSKPGRRVYSSVQDLPRIHNGLGISIISTPKGVLSDAEAREANVGGEVLCTVF